MFIKGNEMPKLFLFVLVLFIVFILSVRADDGDVYYAAEFSEDVVTCDDFENELMDCSTLLLESGDEGPALGGAIGVIADFDAGYEVEINMYKKTDLADEFVFGTTADMCKSLDDDSAPWYPIFESMNITGCPIVAASYPVGGVVINLDFAKDVMNHNFVGDYKMYFELLKDLKRKVCYIIQLAIVEREVEDK